MRAMSGEDFTRRVSQPRPAAASPRLNFGSGTTKSTAMRRLVAAVLVLSSSGVTVLACGNGDSGQSGGSDASASNDASGSASEAGAADGSAAGNDGSTGPVDAAFDARGSNAVCSFNKDCTAAERCECDEATGCFCHLGVRGTGQNGVDKCVTGNDCASALCVEGPVTGVYYCSDECMDAKQCMGALPKCTNIALVGMVCVRM